MALLFLRVLHFRNGPFLLTLQLRILIMANKVPEDGSLLPLMEDFYTLQGEGYHTGKAAYFIRLGGCDIGCHWCDVKESWDAELHPLTPIEQIEIGRAHV